MFKKLKNKKGFTLVELIVVLVILAILAALLVPALTGYIDKAHEQSLTSEASMVLTAAQATVSESYGNGDVELTTGTDGKFTGAVTMKSTATKAAATQINELAEVKDTAHWAISVKVDDKDATYKKIVVNALIYTDGKNAVVYSDGSWGPTLKGVSTLAGVTTKPANYTELLTDAAATAQN